VFAGKVSHCQLVSRHKSRIFFFPRLVAAYNSVAAKEMAANSGVVPAKFPSFRTQAAGAMPFFCASLERGSIPMPNLKCGICVPWKKRGVNMGKEEIHKDVTNPSGSAFRKPHLEFEESEKQKPKSDTDEPGELDAANLQRWLDLNG
jgi:hypothetical protein